MALLRVNRSIHIGQLSSARAAQEGLQMAIVCVGYLEAQVSQENFVNIQQARGGLVDELLKEGFTSRLTAINKRSCHCGMPERGDPGLVG